MRDVVTDSEIRARLIRVEAMTGNFDFLFGLVLGEHILKHTDNLSKTLQCPALTQRLSSVLHLLVKPKLCSSEFFDMFWDRLKVLQEKYGVNVLCLGRGEPPVIKRSDLAKVSTTVHQTITTASNNLSVLDLIVNAVQERFNQPGYAVLQKLEELLLKAARNEKMMQNWLLFCSTTRMTLWHQV